MLQRLLKDAIPIRDLAQILEALGDHAPATKAPAVLTEFARKALVRTITEQYCDAEGGISAIVLSAALEYELCSALHADGDAKAPSFSPEQSLALVREISDAWTSAMDKGHDKTVLLCEAKLRPHLAEMMCRQIPQLPLLAYDEIAVGTNVKSVKTISLEGQLSEVEAAGSKT